MHLDPNKFIVGSSYMYQLGGVVERQGGREASELYFVPPPPPHTHTGYTAVLLLCVVPTFQCVQNQYANITKRDTVYIIYMQ